MYVSVSCICKAHGGQKRVPGPQELELQVDVNLHVGAGNQTKSPARAASALDGWNICLF